ncbi:ligand-binding sensor domain-containing protein [Microlunatus parietis]|uniref:Uncharacterized protein n=1 Tax=Microlunatus parietis TaxID=682979 RepID=A0A7Y9ICR1_9ACTN|nr:PQQ-binding-like beta-propeller repeat protein [Microlunatus parietis]NYE73894.1 hypothetical protein [Microlunatus parietis]
MSQISPASTGHGPATTRALSLLLVFGLLATLLSVLVSGPARAEEPADPNVRYLGEPVQVSQASGSVLGTLDGRTVAYQVFKGTSNSDNPGAFTAFDVETGELLLELPMPTADTARALTVASDGRVYVATYFDQRLWGFDPATRQLADLGSIEPVPTDAQPFGLCAGPAGQVFIATYKSSGLYRYDPATDKITKVRTVNPANTYLHACAWDPATNDLYVTAGGQTAELWRIADAGTGTMTKITDETTTPGLAAETFIMGLWLVGDHLFARTKNLRLLVIGTDGVVDHWSGPQSISGYHVLPVRNDPSKVWFTGSSAVREYDVPTGTVRDTGLKVSFYFSDVTYDDNGDVIGTDARGPFRLTMAGSYTSKPWTYSQPTAIQKLLQGPDGQMFASGYPTGLARVDTTGAGKIYPSLSSGQYESSVVRDGLMYLGHYGNARFSRYDPARPTAAPKLIFDGLAEHQDRPFAMAYNAERDEIYLGTVPGYGRVQGGLAAYEFGTGTHQWYTEEIVKDQSIISVAYNPHDRLVYLGTNVDGGMGIEQPPGLESKLVVWDPATRTVVRELVPVADREGVTGLMVAPDGKIWGWAEDTLFVYDPAGQQVVARYPGLASRYVDGQFYWAWAYQYVSPIDGNVYATVGGRLLRIEPGTMTATQLLASGANFGNLDTAGDLYFSDKSHAYKYVVPQPMPNQEPTDETKCLAVTTLLSGRGLAFPKDYKPAWRTVFAQVERQVDDGKGEELEDDYCR